jgi:hypothetical protein
MLVRIVDNGCILSWKNAALPARVLIASAVKGPRK